MTVTSLCPTLIASAFLGASSGHRRAHSKGRQDRTAKSDSRGMEARHRAFVKLLSDSLGQPRSTASDPGDKRRQEELFPLCRTRIRGGYCDHSSMSPCTLRSLRTFTKGRFIQNFLQCRTPSHSCSNLIFRETLKMRRKPRPGECVGKRKVHRVNRQTGLEQPSGLKTLPPSGGPTARSVSERQLWSRPSRGAPDPPPTPCPAAPSVFPLGVSAQVTHTVQLCGRRFPASPALLFPGISADTASPAPSARVGSPGTARDSCACPGPSLWAPLLPGRFQWPPRTPSSRSQPLLATCLLDPPRSRS